MGIKENLNEIVHSLLPNDPFSYDKEKFINDPILGSIRVRPHEQSIVDTPLFQRLRFIRQTGFTFFTFPTAQHTRFEHSLGVMTIAENIFSSVKRNNGENEKLNNDSLLRIRLAALLHDIGHSAFSHTSEEFYSSLSDIKKYIETNSEFRGKGAGEVLSSLIISSQAFQEFYKKLKYVYPSLKNIDLFHIAKLVTGKPLSNKYGYEADIISGPIDADKLDYFPRDGRAVGLDVSLDISRLVNCIELQEIPSLVKQGTTRTSLVVNRRGYNSLQQLLFARATLTASVYHHHKVRACDAMLKNILQLYCDKGLGFRKSSFKPKGTDLNKTPNYLLITDNDIISEAWNLNDDEEPKKLLKDLFNRDLYKRVLKISIKTITNDSDSEQDITNSKAELAEFKNLRNNPEKREALIEEICSECKSMGLDINKYQLAIDIPHKPNFEKAGNAAINTTGPAQSPNIVTLKEVIPIEDWITGYETFFSHTYIFGPQKEESRAIIAVATAKVLEGKGSSKIILKPTYNAVSEDIEKEVKALERSIGYKFFRE